MRAAGECIGISPSEPHAGQLPGRFITVRSAITNATHPSRNGQATNIPRSKHAKKPSQIIARLGGFGTAVVRHLWHSIDALIVPSSSLRKVARRPPVVTRMPTRIAARHGTSLSRIARAVRLHPASRPHPHARSARSTRREEA